MEFLVTNTLAALLMPPGILVVVLLVALVLARKRPGIAWTLAATTWLALYALSIPYAASRLLALLQAPPLDPLSDKSGQAIVVLGGGTYFVAPEYGGSTVNTHGLVRLRYAAHLYRALGTPVLASGGSSKGNHTPEALLMKQVLEREFQVPVTWVEETSRTTLENARGSYHVLGAAGIKRVYLVTQAWHMPRARYAFETAGFSVIPAPTAFAILPPPDVLSFMPSAQALLHTSWFFHEVIGIGWYHLRVALGR
jgi:uncharacterized SAM-binding protein YcdF (DUF218 family)